MWCDPSLPLPTGYSEHESLHIRGKWGRTRLMSLRRRSEGACPRLWLRPPSSSSRETVPSSGRTTSLPSNTTRRPSRQAVASRTRSLSGTGEPRGPAVASLLGAEACLVGLIVGTFFLLLFLPLIEQGPGLRQAQALGGGPRRRAGRMWQPPLPLTTTVVRESR